jgi:hypothetical protein
MIIVSATLADQRVDSVLGDFVYAMVMIDLPFFSISSPTNTRKMPGSMFVQVLRGKVDLALRLITPLTGHTIRTVSCR